MPTSQQIKSLAEGTQEDGTPTIVAIYNKVSNLLANHEIWYYLVLTDFIVHFTAEYDGRSIRTMCIMIDQERFRPTLIINPYFLAELHLKYSDKVKIGVIKHELLHFVLNHHKRIRYLFNQRKANIACDLEANDFLNPKELPRDALKAETFKLPSGMTLEWYYQHLPDIPNTVGDHTVVEIRTGKTPEHIKIKQPADNLKPSDQIQQHTDKIVSKATEIVTKSRAKMPANLIAAIQSQKKSNRDWRMELRLCASMTFNQAVNQSFRRPDRRVPNLFPSRRRTPIPQLTVAVDTSASISKAELKAFQAELETITEQHGNIIVLQVDAKIQDVAEISSDEIRMNNTKNWKGRGGTNLQLAFDWCKRHGTTALIYMTDGYAPAPDQRQIQTTWVLPPKNKHRHLTGKKIFLKEGTHVQS